MGTKARPRAQAKTRLGAYRAKRDFARTPEPAGGGTPAAQARFVVQEHHASRLHWDFRLEREGVLVSWAVPRGVPDDPDENRLAVHVEDHPLSYIDFAGEIPAGEYGAGRVLIWDRGTYECHKFDADEVVVTLHGQRVRGKYALFRTHGKNWMMHRMEPRADRDYEPMPRDLQPMLARLSRLPADDDRYAFEIKWDGIRALAYIEGGRVCLESRNRLDVTSQYPELRGLGETLGSRRAILDGEIVALDEAGRPSFARLQQRMHLGSDAVVRRRMREVPVTYAIFDLLYLDGRVLMSLPYAERRKRLDALGLAGEAWHVPAYHVGDGAAMLAASRERGLEGVIAKRLDSTYEPGRRSGAWLKIKNQNRQEFVIGGWLPGERHPIGSLLLGYYEGGALRYAGNVGTGFTQAMLDQLHSLLAPQRSERNPFSTRPPKHPVFVEPTQVCEVEFSEWTRDGALRQPSFKGLRPDKDPREVTREAL